MPEHKSTYHDASLWYRIPLSTIERAVFILSKPTPKKSGRLRFRHEAEEKMLVQLLCSNSDRGVTLRKVNLCEALAIIITKMSCERPKHF